MHEQIDIFPPTAYPRPGGWINRKQRNIIDYLQTENEVLSERPI